MNESLESAIALVEAIADAPARLAILAGTLALLLVLLGLSIRRRRKKASKAAPVPPPLPAELREPPPAPPPVAVEEEVAPLSAEGFLGRLRQGLARTQSAFVGRFDALLAGREKIDEEVFEEIEEILYTADLGVATATRLIGKLRETSDKGGGGSALRETLKESVKEILASGGKEAALSLDAKPRVVMFVGVNGVGKTTTIGKIGAQSVAEGKSVILAAADTFRAAAIEQLEIWGNRIGATVIKQQASADPSAVVFDAVAAAKSRKVDLVLVDTAGRLHTKVNLMEELKKMKRIIGREIPGAPHEVILVLDATTGQNAVAQARQFNEAVGVTGIALTKLDGTAKGGIVIAVYEELKLPIRYIGVGESADDLRPFDAHDFVEALFAQE